MSYETLVNLGYCVILLLCGAAFGGLFYWYDKTRDSNPSLPGEHEPEEITQAYEAMDFSRRLLRRVQEFFILAYVVLPFYAIFRYQRWEFVPLYLVGIVVGVLAAKWVSSGPNLYEAEEDYTWQLTKPRTRMLTGEFQVAR